MVVAVHRNLLMAVGGGVLSGALYLSVLSGAPGVLILAYLTQLPLALVGLGLGVSASVAAGLTAIAVIGLAAGLLGAVSFAVFGAAPILLATRMALLARPVESPAAGGSARTESGREKLEWYPPGHLVMWLTGFGVLTFLLTLALAWDHEGGLQGVIHESLTLGLDKILGPSEAKKASIMVDSLAPIFPATVFVSWLVMVTVNLTLAQGFLVRFGRNIRPTPDITALELPHTLPLVVAVVGLLALLCHATELEGPGFASLNLAIMLATPFFFSGLGIVHALIRSVSQGFFLLFLFYAIMVILGWPAFVVVGLGLLDQWADFRKKIHTPNSGGENK